MGKGYGFRERFKDMKTVYLRQLLAKSSDPQRRARMRLLPPPVPSQQGEHALQYERTGTVITKQYRLKPRNIFAVVEAGHGQFKGALPSVAGCNASQRCCTPSVRKDTLCSITLGWVQPLRDAAVRAFTMTCPLCSITCQMARHSCS